MLLSQSVARRRSRLLIGQPASQTHSCTSSSFDFGAFFFFASGFFARLAIVAGEKLRASCY
jgi:hypothetical protein